jgi:hypothetical protein
LQIDSSADAREVTMSSFESDVYVLINWGGDMQRYMLTGPTGFAFRMCDESG